jgi:hypothetical protein
VTVGVAGTGLTPAIAVADSVPPANDLSVPFGNVSQGASSTQTVTISNTGGANLVLGTIASANPLAAPFSVSADPCSGHTIAPTGSCTITLRFAPTAVGTFTDSLDVPSNDPVNPTRTVALQGTSPGVKLARTGQTTCYDSSGATVACTGPAAGQDGALQPGAAWPSPRFTVATGCITDNLTGLTWVRNPDTVQRTWSGALAYANGLVSCGYSDWRLPNLNELASLVNYSQSVQSTWLANQGFGNIQQAGYYWSSTSNARYTSQAWVVYMWGGTIINSTGYPKSTAQGYTLPVRGGSV